MKHAVSFLENAITSSQMYLGLNRTEIFDLSIHYLNKGNEESSKRLHEVTVGGLFSHVTWDMLGKFGADNAVFSRLERLLHSPWENETAAELIKMYTESSLKDFLDPVLLLLIKSKVEQSKSLALEKMDAYFGRQPESLTATERFFYSIHTLNVAFALYAEDFPIDRAQFVNYAGPAIVEFIESGDYELKRIAIWAFYWLAGGHSKDSPLIEVDEKVQEWISSLITSHADMMSGLRLSYLLIKTNSQLHGQLKKELTITWIKNIFYDHIEKKEYPATPFAYAGIVEQCMLKALGLKDALWTYEVIIPYLGLMGSERSISFLESQMLERNAASMNCAIILAGKGLLTEENVYDSGIKKSNLFDEIIRSYPNLVYQVAGKDRTGQMAWYFVLIDEDKKEEFLVHKQGDSYELLDYGSIIASGYGEEVPEDVQIMLAEKYGFDNF